MSINTYSTSPMWSPGYTIESKSNTIVSEFDGGNEQANRLWRFPKRSVSLQYRSLSRAGRDILHGFWKQQHGRYKPFWYFDVVARDWDDEYVGTAGPWNLDGAYICDASASSYTNYTDKSQSTASTDFPVFPSSSNVASGDFAVFMKSVQFDQLTITMGVVSASTDTYVLSWEYADSTNGWTSCTGAGFTDGTTQLKQSGTIQFPTPSSKWVIRTVNDLEYYSLRARISSLTTISVRPWISQVTANTRTYDLHTRAGSSGNVVIYIDGSSVSSTAWSFLSGGGGGPTSSGSDRITLAGTSYPSSGGLITSDISSGYLRIKGRFAEENFPEYQVVSSKYEVAIKINEVQW